MSYLQLLNGITAANGAPVATFDVVTLTTVAGASLVDGERFTIDDGKTVKIFEFDSDGQSKDRVPGSLAVNGPLNVTLIDITGTPTTTQMRDRIIAAIGGLDVTVASGGAAVVTITSNRPGATLKVTEGVANAGFTVVVTTAGTFSGLSLARDLEAVATLEVWTTGASAPVSLNLKLWGYTHRSKIWSSIGIPATPITPPSGNNAASSQILPLGLSNYDYVYLDVSGTLSSSSIFAGITTRMQRRTA